MFLTCNLVIKIPVHVNLSTGLALLGKVTMPGVPNIQAKGERGRRKLIASDLAQKTRIHNIYMDITRESSHEVMDIGHVSAIPTKERSRQHAAGPCAWIDSTMIEQAWFVDSIL